MESALKVVQNRKAARICNIPPELLKYGGADIIREITKMFQVFLENERISDEWKKAIIVPLF